MPTAEAIQAWAHRALAAAVIAGLVWLVDELAMAFYTAWKATRRGRP